MFVQQRKFENAEIKSIIQEGNRYWIQYYMNFLRKKRHLRKDKENSILKNQKNNYDPKIQIVDTNGRPNNNKWHKDQPINKFIFPMFGHFLISSLREFIKNLFVVMKHSCPQKNKPTKLAKFSTNFFSIRKSSSLKEAKNQNSYRIEKKGIIGLKLSVILDSRSEEG